MLSLSQARDDDEEEEEEEEEESSSGGFNLFGLFGAPVDVSSFAFEN